jgi:hypothetical protein
MENRETPLLRKYGENKTTQIMMTIVPHLTASAGRTQYHADGFSFDRVYLYSQLNASLGNSNGGSGGIHRLNCISTTRERSKGMWTIRTYTIIGISMCVKITSN